jgi:hypothetical protein
LLVDSAVAFLRDPAAMDGFDHRREDGERRRKHHGRRADYLGRGLKPRHGGPGVERFATGPKVDTRGCRPTRIAVAYRRVAAPDPGLLSIDHIAVPTDWNALETEHHPALSDGAKISDHDAYVPEVS